MGVEPRLESAYDVFATAKARGTDPSAGAPFDPTESPLHGRAVFLTGAPRSGTTWLQQLLLTHPGIATAGEMHVFCEGLGAVFANHAGTDPHSGLSGWVTRPELVTLARRFVDGMLVAMRDHSRPDAAFVLDKTPDHVPSAALLAEVYPDATFIQIVRDGRDSVASSHDLWSWDPGYSRPGAVAGRWRDAVLDCRTHLGPLRYLEVRYEDLLADTEGGLAGVLDHIGLPHDPDYLRAAAELGRTPVNLRPSRTEVSARKWADMPVDTERAILLAAGDLLVELGYVDERHRDEVLRHWSGRRVAETAATAGRRAAGRAAAAGRELRARRDPRRRRRAEVRRVAEALVAAVRAADAAALTRVLAADAELVEPDRRTSGAADVAARLCAAVGTATLSHLDADESAAAVRWSAPAGGSLLAQVSVDRHRRVTRVSFPAAGRPAPAATR